MKQKTLPKWAWMSAAVAILVVTAFAFSAADTGPRTVSASVVNDSNAYLALEANGDSPHKAFVTEAADGKISVSFGALTGGGTGINPESSYTFDAIINVTNQGTESADVELTFSGTDSLLCEAALTSTTTQDSTDYSATPGPLTLTVGATGYLGLDMSASGKTSGESVECTITVTAS